MGEYGWFRCARPNRRGERRYQDFTKSQGAWFLNQIACIPIGQFYLHKIQQKHSELITDAEFRLYWSGQHHPQGEATAAACVTSIEKRFFYWFLEFPDVMERGGFDCILGNPPYLSGQGLSGTYGHPFCHFVKWKYAPAGLSDLVGCTKRDPTPQELSFVTWPATTLSHHSQTTRSRFR